MHGVRDRAGDQGERIIAGEITAMLIVGLKLGRAEQGSRGVPRRGGVKTAFVEAASHRMGDTEQSGGELRASLARAGMPRLAEVPRPR